MKRPIVDRPETYDAWDMQKTFRITSNIQSTLLLSIVYLFPKFHDNHP